MVSDERLHERVSELASQESWAHRRLARSLYGGLLVMALLSLLAPTLSYFVDAKEAQQEVRQRGNQDARLYADSLAFRLATMETELRRLAKHPEVNVTDATHEPEKELLRHAHRQSAIFSGGVAFLDLAGRATAVSHDRALAAMEHSSRRWFQRALACQCTVVDREGDEREGWVIVVPVSGPDGISGFVAGSTRADELTSKFGLKKSHHIALVSGERVLFEAPPSSPLPRSALSLREEAELPGGAEFSEGGTSYLAFTHPVGDSFDLWLWTRVYEVSAPMRTQLLTQLASLSALQLLIWIGFSIFVRRTYFSFVRMESRIAEQAKLAQLGLASSLIAHEVKNAINGIAAGFAMPSGPNRALADRVIESQLSRLSKLAKMLLTFSKPLRPQLAEVSLSSLVQEVVEGLTMLPESADVSLHVEVDPGLLVSVDPILAATAIDNVTRNAIEASVAAKDTGKVATAEVRISGSMRHDQVTLCVEDNGGGPPGDFEVRAFEPFVTSKSKGVGLGLTIARQAIEAMGGAVQFERTEQGSRFNLAFVRHRGEHPIHGTDDTAHR